MVSAGWRAGVLGLLVFRLFWGFAGSGTVRFANFVKDAAATLAYLGKLPSPTN